MSAPERYFTVAKLRGYGWVVLGRNERRPRAQGLSYKEAIWLARNWNKQHAQRCIAREGR